MVMLVFWRVLVRSLKLQWNLKNGGFLGGANDPFLFGSNGLFSGVFSVSFPGGYLLKNGVVGEPFKKKTAHKLSVFWVSRLIS